MKLSPPALSPRYRDAARRHCFGALRPQLALGASVNSDGAALARLRAAAGGGAVAARGGDRRKKPPAPPLGATDEDPTPPEDPYVPAARAAAKAVADAARPRDGDARGRLRGSVIARVASGGASAAESLLAALRASPPQPILFPCRVDGCSAKNPRPDSR